MGSARDRFRPGPASPSTAGRARLQGRDALRSLEAQFFARMLAHPGREGTGARPLSRGADILLAANVELLAASVETP